jgi:hypothetical protein
MQLAETGFRIVARVRRSPAGGPVTGQGLANSGHVGTWLAAPQGRQALRDTRNSLAVAEDLRRHLQTLKVIYRQQDSLGLSIAGQGFSLMLLTYSAGQLRQTSLSFRQ